MYYLTESILPGIPCVCEMIPGSRGKTLGSCCTGISLATWTLQFTPERMARGPFLMLLTVCVCVSVQQELLMLWGHKLVRTGQKVPIM